MYSYISGRLIEVEDNNIIVDNHGIGYCITSSTNSIACLPEKDSDVLLYTRLIHKEDAMELYGFLSKEERDMFVLLNTVSGIGPKGAVATLSTMTVNDIQVAVATADLKAFSSVPGIGKKTAEKALIDLKGKVDFVGTMEKKLASASSKSVDTAIIDQVQDALVGLGYPVATAKKALKAMTITESTTVDQLLTDTLKQMSLL